MDQRSSSTITSGYGGGQIMAIVEDAGGATGEYAAGIGEGIVKEIQMGVAVEKTRGREIAIGVLYRSRCYTLGGKILDVENPAGSRLRVKPRAKSCQTLATVLTRVGSYRGLRVKLLASKGSRLAAPFISEAPVKGSVGSLGNIFLCALLWLRGNFLPGLNGSTVFAVVSKRSEKIFMIVF